MTLDDPNECRKVSSSNCVVGIWRSRFRVEKDKNDGVRSAPFPHTHSLLIAI